MACAECEFWTFVRTNLLSISIKSFVFPIERSNSFLGLGSFSKNMMVRISEAC